jgi:nucleotide-binding universal stress UspA family protein
MKILIATDGSDYSKAAINFCRNIIAEPENTSVKILSSVERPVPFATEPFAVSAEYYNELEQLGLKNAKQFVSLAGTQVQSLFSDVPLKEVSTEVMSGTPEQAIIERAKEWDADLIVVGSHGYGFWSRALLGSVSNSVVHHAPCSVLVVKKSAGAYGNKN